MFILRAVLPCCHTFVTLLLRYLTRYDCLHLLDPSDASDNLQLLGRHGSSEDHSSEERHHRGEISGVSQAAGAIIIPSADVCTSTNAFRNTSEDSHASFCSYVKLYSDKFHFSCFPFTFSLFSILLLFSVDSHFLVFLRKTDCCGVQ